MGKQYKLPHTQGCKILKIFEPVVAANFRQVRPSQYHRAATHSAFTKKQRMIKVYPSSKILRE